MLHAACASAVGCTLVLLRCSLRLSCTRGGHSSSDKQRANQNAESGGSCQYPHSAPLSCRDAQSKRRDCCEVWINKHCFLLQC
jgi:hypothetical protein